MQGAPPKKKLFFFTTKINHIDEWLFSEKRAALADRMNRQGFKAVRWLLPDIKALFETSL